MIYVSSPYSHPDIGVRTARFEAACAYTLDLMKRGEMVYSPIAYSHQFEAYLGFMEGHKYWMPFDLRMLGQCSEMHVLKLLGWQNSVGVRLETEHCATLRIPVKFIDCTQGADN